MKKLVLLLVLAALLAGSVPVLADGVFYWTESIPPEIPYQRALLIFDGSYETLIVQSKYRMSSAATDEFGWVVPVPSVPELASVDSGMADALFYELGDESQPSVTRVSDAVWGLVGVTGVFIAPAAGILLLLLVVASFFTPSLELIRRRRKLFAIMSVLLLFIAAISIFAVALFVYNPYARPMYDSGGYAVDVIREEQVGIYNVQVLKAGDAGELLGWLSENGFQFDEEDRRVFDDYLRRGWCFVVARVDPRRGAGGRSTDEGLVAPLILRFPTVAPVYPLALTATAGSDTQVLLYVLGENKWQNDGRLELEYAGNVHLSLLEAVCREALPDMPTGCFAYGPLSYLCKFKGTLTPVQMAEDMVFGPAQDDEPYRKHITMW